MVHRAGEGPRAGDRRRRIELDRGSDRAVAARRKGGRRRRADRDALLQQADPRRACISTSRRSTTPSAFRSSSTTFRARSVIDMSVETMKRLFELKNIAGVKDATANVLRVSQQRAAMGADFNQLSGEDGTALGFMAHGGHGCISVTSNVAPRLCAEFQSACLKGDYKRRAEASGQAAAAASATSSSRPIRRRRNMRCRCSASAPTPCGCRWCRCPTSRRRWCAKPWCMPA